MLVAVSADYLWFPTLIKRGRELLAVMSHQSDTYHATFTAMGAWSDDDGRHWTAPFAMPWGDGPFTLPNGALQLLPFNLQTRDTSVDEFQSDAAFIEPNSRKVIAIPNGVSIGGLPARVAEIDKTTGRGILRMNGDTVPLRDGGFLTTAYGRLEGDERRRTMVLASRDGRAWKYRPTVATADTIPSGEGPTEASVCRLRDGRLMCVFRRAAYAAYGQAWSSDDGLTWTKPAAMKIGHSVQPSLITMADGTLVLSGGRPGIFIWLDFDGTGERWQEVSLHAHHNAALPERQIPFIEKPKSSQDMRTSSYTQVVALDERRLLVIYDYLPNGWLPLPPDSPQRNQVWCVEVTVERN